MSLLKPTPGEAADRQTILKLKCEHGKAKQIDIKRLQDEWKELQDYLERNWLAHSTQLQRAQFGELLASLASTNRQLWMVEDEVRIRMQEVPLNRDRLAEIAIEIPKANDKRSRLVRAISKLFGLDDHDKIYAAS